MAPFSSRVITSKRRTWAFSLCTALSELEWITSFYYPHNPLWYSGDGLPCVKGLDRLEWPTARGQGTHDEWKRNFAFFLRMFVFYLYHYYSRRLFGPLYCTCTVFATNTFPFAGRGQLPSPTVPLRSKLPMTCCHQPNYSSLPLNETRLLALAEGSWSGWEKRTGETSLCGESEALGIWAGVSSLSAGHWDSLPRCFFFYRSLGVAFCKENYPNWTGTAARLRNWISRVANQPSRLRSLGPAARRVNGEQASGISGGKVVVAEGEEIWGSYRPLI